MLNNLTIQKFVFGMLILSIQTYSWSRLIISWFKLRKEWKRAKIYRDRHDCVVMFHRERGLAGYPYWKYSKTNIGENCCEPILYFIKTAKKSIDVAVMTISSEIISEELLSAHKRGIKIRLLLDLDYRSESIEKLQNCGVPILYYVCPFENLTSIMHYKYAIKDYSEGTGFVCWGSINWVTSSFQNNYENLIFSTDPNLIEDFHANFEESWKIIYALQEDYRLHKNITRR